MDLSGTGQEPVAGSSELGDVKSGCIKGGECRMDGIPTSYLGSPGFKSRSGNRLPWPRCVVFFTSPLRQSMRSDLT